MSALERRKAKKEGLDGKRSGLFYEATRLIRELRSRGCGLRFAVAENVGGLFSADDGLALATHPRASLDCVGLVKRDGGYSTVSISGARRAVHCLRFWRRIR